MSGRNLKQTNQDKKRARPLRLLKSSLTSNGRGDSSRREIVPNLTPAVFRTPTTVIKTMNRRKKRVKPPIVQQADNLVARHSPQKRVGVDTGLTPFDPGEMTKQPVLSLASRVRFKPLSHLVTNVKTGSEKNKPSSRYHEETGAGVKLFPRFEVPSHKREDSEGVGVKSSPHSLEEEVLPLEGGGLRRGGGQGLSPFP